ncbi:MAG: caspase family protein [Synechococcales bacterium]|nr:caspase family protein [Synechococcales bacterium]
MRLRRRAFLQQASLALATLGVSQTGLSLMASRCQQVLAAPTSRRLALLVGINQYPETVCDCPPLRGAALQGAVTDIDLQRELLIHRFGFQPADVLTLSDGEATRSNIEAAFDSHLVAQARPGDVVVFHFSGFGSRVRLHAVDGQTGLVNQTDPVLIRNSLVPVDGLLPTEEAPLINDLMEDTLALLLRSLQTEEVVTVLDLSYAQPSATLVGGLRIRSRPSVPSGQLNPTEQDQQQVLISKLRSPRKAIAPYWDPTQLPGVILTASSDNQIAAEAQWNGFSAGLFTYALTQQLWWTTPETSISINLSQAGGTVEQVAGVQQRPTLMRGGRKPPNFDGLSSSMGIPGGADGVVVGTDQEGDSTRVWLAGLPAVVLANYGASSLLSVVPSDPLKALGLDKAASSDAVATEAIAPEIAASEPPLAKPPQAAEPSGGSDPKALNPANADGHLLQVRSRDGLYIKAKPCCRTGSQKLVQTGQLVREILRTVPRNIGLTVALDFSLERIERVDATSAIAGIPKINSVVAGEQPADCLFGKAMPPVRTAAASLATGTTSSDATRSADTPVPPSGISPGNKVYGLFNLGRTAIPNTLIESEEAVKTAINRMTPQLRTLLAAKLLRLTTNQGTSRLGVRATLEMVAPQERILMQQTTVRARWSPPDNRLATLLTSQGEVPSLPIGSRIQFRVLNYSDRPVYCILLGVDSGGNATALYPAIPDRSSEASTTPGDGIIAPGEILTVPQANISAEWSISGPPGLAETHLIFSQTPFSKTVKVLEKAMRPMGNSRRLSLVSDPLAIAEAVLDDLSHSSLTAESIAGLDIPSDVYALHVDRWATLSFIYQVVDA